MNEKTEKKHISKKHQPATSALNAMKDAEALII